MDDLTTDDDESPECDPLMQAFAARLSEICGEKGLEKNQKLYRTLGKKFGIGPKGVEKWFLGKSWPRNPTMIGLSVWADVTIDWLMSGRAPKRHSNLYSSEPIARVAAVIEAMDPERQYLAARLVDQVAQPAGNDGTTPGGNSRSHSGK